MIAVEYSARQDCFNIDTLESVLKTNIRQMKQKIDCDYRIIAIVNNYQEANKICEKAREIINKE